ncbi:MAG: DUF551 domain-containing protein [Moraxellaceae bacterium]|nr:DUF551 domain-containing protein [Moraxellaceae bacterium]
MSEEIKNLTNDLAQLLLQQSILFFGENCKQEENPDKHKARLAKLLQESIVIFQEKINTFLNLENDKNGWISVDDRLPHKDGWYLVYFRFLCEIKKFSNGEWQNQRLGSTITHWQPLPQPPFIIRMEDLKDE